MIHITQQSHTDHNLTLGHLDFIKERFANRTKFFIEAVDIPEHLSGLPSALHGPTCGDGPVPESEVYYEARNGRPGKSRMVRRLPRLVRRMVVIAAPRREGGGMFLITAYGGLNPAPREPFDKSLDSDPVAKAEAVAFWAAHALNPEQ